MVLGFLGRKVVAGWRGGVRWQVVVAVVAWAEAEWKRQNPKSTSTPDGPAVRTVLGETLHVIRFPTMPVADIAGAVPAKYFARHPSPLCFDIELGQC